MIRFLTIVMLIATTLLSAQKRKIRRPKKEKVKVEVNYDTILKPSTINLYRNGAQVKLFSFLKLKKGVQTVRIYGLRSDIDPENLLPSHSHAYSINRLEFFSTGNLPKNKDEQEYVRIQQQLKSYELYQLMLKRIIHSNDPSWAEGNENSFPKEYSGVLSKIQELKEKLKLKQFTRLDKNSTQLSSYNLGLLLELKTKKEGLVKFEMVYVDHKSRWEPNVQIFVDSKTNTTTLVQQALLYQRSGFDWNGVKLTLVDGNMQNHIYQPTLSPWKLDLVNYEQNRASQPHAIQRSVMAKYSNYDAQEQEDVDEKTDNNYTVPNQESHLPSYTFKSIHLPHSLNSILVPYKQTIIPSKIAHKATPQMDNRVLLVAELLSSRTPVMTAKAKIFYNGKLIRDSRVDFGTSRDLTSEYIPLALDYDPNIMVSYEEIPSMRQESYLSSNKSTTYEYQLAVSSYYKTPVDVDVKIRIPVSIDEKIEVEFIPTLDMKYEPKKGFIQYNIQLRPEGNLVKKVKYRVSLPKDEFLKKG